MGRYRNIFICQRATNIINCAQELASLINKQGTTKNNVYLFQHQGHTNKMDSEYLENYA